MIPCDIMIESGYSVRYRSGIPSNRWVSPFLARARSFEISDENDFITNFAASVITSALE